MAVSKHGDIRGNSLTLYNVVLTPEVLNKTKKLNNILSVSDAGGLAMNGTASGTKSVSLGNNNQALGVDSFSVGASNVSKETRSNTMGQGNTANSKRSFAGGLNTNVIGDETIAYGNNLKTNSHQSAAFGKFNEGDATAVLSVGYGTDENSRKDILKMNRYGELSVNVAPAFTNNGYEPTLKLGETSLTESKLAALLAEAGGAGAAVVCNFVGYDDASDDPAALDTATLNEALQKLQDIGGKILILNGMGCVDSSNLILDNLIIVATKDSGIDVSMTADKYGYYNFITFKNSIVYGGKYIAECGIEFENTEMYNANCYGYWYETCYATGKLKIIDSTISNDITLHNNTEVIIKNSEIYNLFIGGKHTSFTKIDLIENDINEIAFSDYDTPNYTIGSIYLKGNDNLYGVILSNLHGSACTVKNFTAIDNIGGNGYQDLITGCTIGGVTEWGEDIGTVTFEKVTLAHNMDKDKNIHNANIGTSTTADGTPVVEVTFIGDPNDYTYENENAAILNAALNSFNDKPGILVFNNYYFFMGSSFTFKNLIITAH